MKCDMCYWTFDNQCVCEDEETHSSPTQYTDKCIGYLDRNFEEQLWSTYSECIELLAKRKLDELQNIKNFILNQRN
jgi:hypothetical protein